MSTVRRLPSKRSNWNLLRYWKPEKSRQKAAKHPLIAEARARMDADQVAEGAKVAITVSHFEQSILASVKAAWLSLATGWRC